ncbi:unnamed protein product [marine sediment metagenome]|uniref:Uncharacterized protein n=1 Tax=marine sediment metagenome TaxID=412755 RepID=X1JVU8_9ZZZZ
MKRRILVLRIRGKAKDVFGALGHLAYKWGKTTLGDIMEKGDPK